MSCDGNLWFEQDQPLSSPYMAALAFKAAELQGKKSRCNFSEICREPICFKENITDENVLVLKIQVSILKNLKDLHSQARSRRFNVT